MPVLIQGDTDTGMTQPLGDHFRMDTRRDQVAGMGVPEPMKMDVNPSPFADGLQRVADGLQRGIDHADAQHAAILAREYQTQVLPDRAQAELLFEQVLMV